MAHGSAINDLFTNCPLLFVFCRRLFCAFLRDDEENFYLLKLVLKKFKIEWNGVFLLATKVVFRQVDN